MWHSICAARIAAWANTQDLLQPPGFGLKRVRPSGWTRWLRSRRADVWEHVPPEPGSRRHIRVTHPFHAAEDAPFWVMFNRGMASQNGWVEDPEAIPISVFAQCRLVKVVQDERSWAWILVSIDEVVSTEELEGRFPAVQVTRPWPSGFYQTGPIWRMGGDRGQQRE